MNARSHKSSKSYDLYYSCTMIITFHIISNELLIDNRLKNVF
jgi:hypothetical protein